MTSTEKALTRSYGLLSSRVTEALNAVCLNGGEDDEARVRTFENGERFLDQLISGSRFVEGQKLEKGELAPRNDAIRAFQHAFLTLRHLSRLHENDTASEALQELRADLVRVRATSQSRPLEAREVANLSSFFSALSSQLADDLTRQRLEGATPSRRSVGEFPIDEQLPA